MSPEPVEPPSNRTHIYGSFQEIVTLVVGAESNSSTFTIHQNVLCESSTFFKAACKPEWMKQEDRVIRLPEDEREVIQGMIYWMYCDEIHVPYFIYDSQSDEPMTGDVMKTGWALFAKLYVLGEKYDIPRLRHHATDGMIIHRHQSKFDIRIVTYVYQNTLSEDDRFRRLLVDLAVSEFANYPYGLHIVKHSVCANFFCDLAIVVMERFNRIACGENVASFSDDPKSVCFKYHRHGEGGEVCDDLKPFRVGDQNGSIEGEQSKSTKL